MYWVLHVVGTSEVVRITHVFNSVFLLPVCPFGGVGVCFSPVPIVYGGLLQLHMRISFPFLLAKGLRRFLLIMRTRSFLLSCK